MALALAACATIAPERHAVMPRPVPEALPDPALALDPAAWPSPSWWTIYGDRRLDALIEQGLRENPSLEAAKARIDAANAAAELQRFQRGGQLSLDAGVNRQRYSANGLFPAPIGGSVHNDLTLGLKAGYDADWWGKHRARIAAAVGEANARVAEQSQARQLLAAAIARSYFDLQFLRARISNTGQQLETASALLADQRKRIARGLARIDQQRDVELDIARLEQQAARLKADAGRERETLRALCGGAAPEPGAVPPAPAPAANALPERLGMELLAHRADLQAARYRVEASLGRIAAARAAYYPDFNLMGGIGLDAESLGRLLRAGSITTLVGSALQLPLFDNARLGAALDTVRAQRDEVIADYNQAVLNAVREVARQGYALRGANDELARNGAAAAAASALQKAAHLRERHGLGDHAAALRADAAVLAQVDAALQLRQAQRQAEIGLNQALGGGYTAAAGALPFNSTIAERRHD